MTLGEKIKEYRNTQGFSQEKIAELVCVSRQAVTKWEADQSIPCMENLMALADIFGISLSELSGKINKEILKMRSVKNSWRTYGSVTLILSASFLVATVVFLIIRFAIQESTLNVLPVTMGINGMMWLILGVIFSAYAKREYDKLTRLKSEGLRYDAKIERIVRNHYWIRIGSILSGYAECSYQNQDGKKCMIKSNAFLLEEQFSDYNVSVYVSRSDPTDYAVELSIGEGQPDYDYR